jgi:DNA-binding NtrC family response regulator
VDAERVNANHLKFAPSASPIFDFRFHTIALVISFGFVVCHHSPLALPLREINMKPFVLIVDDEPLVRNVLTELLRHSEFAAVEAENTSQALRILRTSRPKITALITDVKMPGILDGVDLAKFTLNSWPWIKVIVATGFAESVRERVPHNVHFLPKPWKTNEMMNRVRDAVGTFEMNQAVGTSR